MLSSRSRYAREFKEWLVEEVLKFSKPIADVAREYGIAAQSLGNWVSKLREIH